MSDALSLSTLKKVCQFLDHPALIVDYETRRIVAVNNAFVADSGYTAEQVVGQPTSWFSLISKEDRDRLYARLSEEWEVSATVLGRDAAGGVGEFVGRFLLIEVGGKRYVLITSERHLGMRDELRLSGQLLQAVLEVFPGLIWQYTYDSAGRGRVTYLAGKTHELLGLSAEAIVADETQYWNRIPYEYRLEARRLFELANANQTPWEVEHPFSHAVTGEERWMRLIAFPKASPDGSIRWTGLGSDVTEVQELRNSQYKIQSLLDEERMRKSKLESLGTLAGGIAHDFNNLLAILTGNLSLIKRDASLSAEHQRRLDAIERATKRAELLAKQLVTFAKGGDPILENISLESCVVEPMQYVLEARGIEAVFEPTAGLWTARGDKGQLMQVFQNLASNAADAMPSGGRVEVRFQNCTFTAQDSVGLAPGDYVRISVTDTGCGIPPEHLARIFDPYFTTKSGGHGLGLAISYSIITKHGGEIRVASTVGVGTRFEVYLPANRQREATASVTKLTPNESARMLRRRLLVLDDDDLIRDLLGSALEGFGYGVVACRRGEEVIERYRAAREVGQPFLGAILDLRIANGLGGLETLKRLRQLDPSVTAIVCSGYHEDGVMSDYRAHGFAAKLPKPFEITELERLLQKLFGSVQPS